MRCSKATVKLALGGMAGQLSIQVSAPEDRALRLVRRVELKLCLGTASLAGLIRETTLRDDQVLAEAAPLRRKPASDPQSARGAAGCPRGLAGDQRASR